MTRRMAGRVTVLVLSLIAGVIVAKIDAAPYAVLIVLGCMAWGVYLVFLAVVNRRPAAKPCSCHICRAPRQYAAAHIEQVWP
jgi:hypothetical protein